MFSLKASFVIALLAVSASALSTAHLPRNLNAHRDVVARAPVPAPVEALPVARRSRNRRASNSKRCQPRSASSSSTSASSSTASPTPSSTDPAAAAPTDTPPVAAAPDPPAAPSSSASDPAPTDGSDDSDPAPADPAPADPAPPAPSPPASSGGDGGSNSGGFATYFYQNGVAGACGTVHSDSDFICAMDSDRYEDGANGGPSPLCGKQVVITNTNNGKSVTVTVADECPTCVNGNSIDLSSGAFQAIAAESDGMVPITWSFA